MSPAVTSAPRNRRIVESNRNVVALAAELLRPRWTTLTIAVGLVLLNRATAMVLPASTRFLVDNVLIARRGDRLVPLVAVVAVATLAQAAITYGLNRLLSRESAETVGDLRTRMQAHICRLPLIFHDGSHPGALAARVIADVESVKDLFGQGLLELIGRIAMAVYAFAFLFPLSPRLTLITVVFIGAYCWFTKIRMTRLRPLVADQMAARESLSGRLTESMSGIRVVKGYGIEAAEDRAFGEGNQRLLTTTWRVIRASSVVAFANAILLGAVSLALTYEGATQVLSGTLSVGSFMTFTAFVGYLIGPMAQLSAIGELLTGAFVALERTEQLLATQAEHTMPRRTMRLTTFAGQVALRAVSFSYDGRRPALSDISFATEPGRVTAIVGPSGSGKSTIVSLIAGFYEPSRGAVLVDNRDLGTIRLEDYRRYLGLVSQDTFLFSGSIRDNVAVAKRDASDAEILRACRMAHVDEFVRRLPARYDTVVGDRGVRLSAGQRQRVAIARAVLADPRLVILDEATSNLDSQSEAAVQRGLEHLMRTRTTVMVAHRMSTVRHADEILVVEGGRIVERGTHDTLFALGRRYRAMCVCQSGGLREHGSDDVGEVLLST